MKSSNDVCVIIAAAGKGERAALGYNKTLWRDGGCSIVRKTAEKFGFVKKIIVACARRKGSYLGRIQRYA